MRYLKTPASWAPIFVRLALGIVLTAHGAQKLLGVWGGGGWDGTIQFFDQSLGIPAPLTILAMLTEFVGGIAIIIGVLTRLAALGATMVMLVAVYTVHLPDGFFLNFACNPPEMGHGFEYNLALIGLAVSLIISGGGNLSIDRGIAGGD